MNIQTKAKLHPSRLRALLAGVGLFAGMSLVTTTAHATIAYATITASIGGVPSSGDVYETFNSVPLGNGTFTTPSGITVSFGGNAQAVTGAASGLYAAPFLSGNNGLNFGGQPDGADTTTYLSSGSTGSDSLSEVTLTFAGPTNYLGLLWGSVDAYNTLTFYNGTTVVGTFTGDDVTSAANGDQSAQGTYFVNINLSDSFTSVVATSSQYAFEFDNVAISADPLKVPEPGTAGVFLLGLLLLGSACWLKGRQLS